MRKLFACLMGMICLAAQADTFEVTTTSDSGAGSLRQAITDANNSVLVPHFIVFKSPYPLGGQTTLLSNLPIITATDVRLRGGTSKPTISGNALFAILRVGTNVSLEVNGLGFIDGLNDVGGCISLNIPLSTSSLEVFNSTFHGCKANEASYAGGGAIGWRSATSQTVRIENSKFTNNSAVSSHAPTEQPRGGAIESSAGTTIRDSLFENNQVDSAGTLGGYGGAVFIQSPASSNEISGSTFKSNVVKTTTSDLGYGGAVRAYFGTDSVFLLENNVFEDNQARTGGALHLNTSGGVTTTVMANNNTFIDNTAETEGGAVYLAAARLIANHNTFYHNGAAAGSDLFFKAATIGRFVHNVLAVTRFEAACSLPDSTIVSGYLKGNLFNEDCGILSSTGGVISNNLAVLEFNTDREPGVLVFAPGSAPIDGGTLNPSDCLPTDARRTARPMDGDMNGTAICDVGAYEHPGDTLFRNGFE